MCRRIDCQTCGKPTFAGCGAHIEQVLGDVPREQRCPGHVAPDDKAKAGAEAPPTKRPDDHKRS